MYIDPSNNSHYVNRSVSNVKISVIMNFALLDHFFELFIISKKPGLRLHNRDANLWAK